MLTVGIVIMVLSIVLGVVALTSLALMSSGGRAARGRVSTTLALSDRRPGGSYHPGDASYYSPEEDAPVSATAADQPPQWVLVLAIASAAGLVLGLLLAMLASIP